MDPTIIAVVLAVGAVMLAIAACGLLRRSLGALAQDASHYAHVAKSRSQFAAIFAGSIGVLAVLTATMSTPGHMPRLLPTVCFGLTALTAFAPLLIDLRYRTAQLAADISEVGAELADLRSESGTGTPPTSPRP